MPLPAPPSLRDASARCDWMAAPSPLPHEIVALPAPSSHCRPLCPRQDCRNCRHPSPLLHSLWRDCRARPHSPMRREEGNSSPADVPDLPPRPRATPDLSQQLQMVTNLRGIVVVLRQMFFVLPKASRHRCAIESRIRQLSMRTSRRRPTSTSRTTSSSPSAQTSR
jgi:hypothetical protein